jgi:hypothetical protein
MQGSRVREENQASVMHSNIASIRQEEFGSELRSRLETAGGYEIEGLNDLEEEPISPELILVSSPEVARRAREQLAVPLHRPAYDDTTAATSEATAVLREIRAVVPAGLPDTTVARRKKMPWWMVVAAVVLVAAAAGVLVLRDHRGDRTSNVSAPPAQKTRSDVAPTTASPTPRRSTDAAPATHRPKTVRHRRAAAPATTTTVAPKSTTAAPTVEGSRPLPPRTAPNPPAKTTPAPSVAPTFVPSRVFAWPPDAAASGYLVRFFRDGAKVYERHVTKPRLTLPSSFRFLPGHYRWEVLPIRGSATDTGAPIVESTFVLTAGSGT